MKITRAPEEAAQLLRDGGLVAHPTLGLWGIGADPESALAVERLRAIKQTPARSGFIVAAGEFGLFAGWVDADERTARFVQHPFDGPVTAIVRAGPMVPPAIVNDTGTIAMRVEAHPALVGITRALGRPIITTSLNFPGEPAPATLALLDPRLAQRLHGALDLGPAPDGTASTLVRIDAGGPTIVRPGRVSGAALVATWDGL